MSIEKIRHGSEITSSKLNEIIEILNTTNNEHQTIRNLGESITKALAEVYSKLDTYSEQVGEHLDSLPEIRNLYADILLARDSIDWIDLHNNSEESLALLADALNGPVTTPERLKIIRGTAETVNLSTPKLRDRQILISYTLGDTYIEDPKGDYMYMNNSYVPYVPQETEEELPRYSKLENQILHSTLFFDCIDATGTLRRVPVTASGDIKLHVAAPTFSFVHSEDGKEVYLKMNNPDGSTDLSFNLKGEKGESLTFEQLTEAQKAQLRGDRGPSGKNLTFADLTEEQRKAIKGDKGKDGANGATPIIAIKYSNNNYNEQTSDTYIPGFHTYMGIKTYYNTDSADKISSTPYTWIKISGDTLYPKYDPISGELFFDYEQPSGELRFNIKGEEGPQGPPGEMPKVSFKVKDENGNVVVKPADHKVVGENTTDVTYVYDASWFKGPKGDPLTFEDLTDSQKKELTGPTGPTPRLRFKAKTSTKDTAEIEEVIPNNPDIDREYTISIPKGRDGLSLVYNEIDLEGNTLLYFARNLEELGEVNKDNIKDKISLIDKIINLGSIKGEKGDKGDAGALQINGKYDSTSELPTDKSDTEKVFMGAAYAITSTNSEGVSTAELYILTDLEKDTWQEMYTNLGNIKGEKGDTGQKGQDGQKWFVGKDITIDTPISSDTKYNIGDYYINSITGDVLFVANKYTNQTVFSSAGLSLKGPKGDIGSVGPKGDSTELTHSKEGSIHTIVVKNTTQQKVVDDVTGNITYEPQTTTKSISFNEGRDGDAVQLRSNGAYIQWKYVTEPDTAYKDLVSLESLIGQAGTQIYTDTTVPTSNIGIEGDFYINELTGDLYRKRSASDWGYALFSILGVPGATWYTGTDVTSAGTLTTNLYKFKVGDLYLNTYSTKAFKVTKVEGNAYTFEELGALRGPKVTYIDSVSMPPASEYLQKDIIILSNWDVYVHNGTGWGTKVGNIRGDNGSTPYVQDGYWYIDGVSLGVKATGDTGSYIKATKEYLTDTSIVLTMAQSTYYECTMDSTTDITLTKGWVAPNTVGEFVFQFSVHPSKKVPVVAFTDPILYANGFTNEYYVPGYTYILYILNNICYVSSVPYTPQEV